MIPPNDVVVVVVVEVVVEAVLVLNVAVSSAVVAAVVESEDIGVVEGIVEIVVFEVEEEEEEVVVLGNVGVSIKSVVLPVVVVDSVGDSVVVWGAISSYSRPVNTDAWAAVSGAMFGSIVSKMS